MQGPGNTLQRINHNAHYAPGYQQSKEEVKAANVIVAENSSLLIETKQLKKRLAVIKKTATGSRETQQPRNLAKGGRGKRSIPGEVRATSVQAARS